MPAGRREFSDHLLQGREIVSPLYILNELEEPQGEQHRDLWPRYSVSVLSLLDIRRRAWNSGFHTGMGKRYGNRVLGLMTIFGSHPETLTLDVKRYIDWLAGYPGKGRAPWERN